MMKNLKYILLAVILFPLMGIVSSCSDETETEGEFDNWQEKNEAILTQWAANSSYQKILTYTKNAATSGMRNSDFIYVEVLESGSGTETPLYSDTCRVAYRGHFIPTASYSEGYVFSQTYSGDFNWGTAGTTSGQSWVDGFSTALQHMHVGDRWRVRIPYTLAYGESANTSGSVTIPAYSNLVFEIALYDFWHPGETRPIFKSKKQKKNNLLKTLPMPKYADYIKRIEIDSLWSGKKHIVWELNRHVNILSGMNGEGKSTILNKVVKGLIAGGEFPSHMLKGVHLDVEPEDAKWIRYDMIRSLDSNLQQALAEGEGFLRQALSALAGVGGGSLLDIQLYNLQRKYLDYQVNIGNRIIEKLQTGDTEAAQQLSQKKTRFQDIVDDLFRDTGKKMIRTENELRFTQIGEVLLPYQLSSGEKQILIILLTVLVEDNQPYVLFMDEPEVSLHLEWQKCLVDLCLELNPNVQIILTTHSPAIVMNGWVDSVTEVSDITV